MALDIERNMNIKTKSKTKKEEKMEQWKSIIYVLGFATLLNVLTIMLLMLQNF